MFGLLQTQEGDIPKRRKHRKSRNGCDRCKQRKLKCDETHPICGNCSRHLMHPQQCDYRLPSGSVAHSTTRIRALAPKELSLPSRGVTGKVDSARSSLSQESDAGDWQSYLPKSIRAGMLDPFESHPQSTVSGVDVLMKHYLQTVVYKSFPWQPASSTNPTTTYYVPLLWSDPVLFHAMLQLSALRMECLDPRSTSQTRQISSECIRLLAERVQDPTMSVSDQTISAVSTLASIEHEKGNVRMLRMHIQGLTRMLNIRGGLNAVRKTSPMVANNVLWTFVIASYEVPFPNLEPKLTFEPSFSDVAPPPDEPVPLDLEAFGVAQPVASMLAAVQHVSQLITTHASYSTASSSLMILTRMCSILSHLLSLPPIEPSSSVSINFSESTRLAILLHVFCPWRGLKPDGTLAINNILHKLKAYLMSLIAEGQSNGLMLWLLATAGVAALGMPERVWFVGHLVTMTQEMGINDWEAMKRCLVRVIWHEILCARPHRKLWEEVDAQRKVQSQD